MESKKIYTFVFACAFFACTFFSSVSFAADTASLKEQPKAEQKKEAANSIAPGGCVVDAPVNAIFVKPLQVVQNPSKFLNQDIKMNATFDKFSTLGLDYKKALRESKDYIGFLIQRDDVSDHNLPLSEMKLFLKRDYAEKFIDLDTGDRIEITGKMFSCALGDPWIDVNQIVVLKKAKVQEDTKEKAKSKK